MRKAHRRAGVAGEADLDEILPEYDFSRAWPNKYASRYASRSKAAQREVELQGSVPLDAEAIFRHGFSGENARRAFIADMADLAGTA